MKNKIWSRTQFVYIVQNKWQTYTKEDNKHRENKSKTQQSKKLNSKHDYFFN